MVWRLSASAEGKWDSRDSVRCLHLLSHGCARIFLGNNHRAKKKSFCIPRKTKLKTDESNSPTGIFEVPRNVCHSSFLSPPLLETNRLGSLFKFLVKTQILGISGNRRSSVGARSLCVVQVPGKSLCSPMLENFCSRWVRGTSLTCQWWGLRASIAGGEGSIPGQGTKIQ